MMLLLQMSLLPLRVVLFSSYYCLLVENIGPTRSSKAGSGSSPFRPKPSNLFLEDSATSGFSSTEENEPSPDISDLRYGYTNGPQSLGDGDCDEIKIIVEKLELLLVDQLRELDELKQQHELNVLDLLKELPPEVRRKVVRTCNAKMSD